MITNKNKKNIMSNEWPGYMLIQQCPTLEPAAEDLKKQKDKINQEVNLKVGESVDVFLPQGDYCEQYKYSESIFGQKPKHSRFQGIQHKFQEDTAGLGFTNGGDKYIYFNGKKDKPKIFANFIEKAKIKVDIKNSMSRS